jgi:methylglutaconyl-CoA hydratase
MAGELVLKTEQPRVVRLTLNRPQKRNALTRELLEELKQHVDAAAKRDDLRLLVLAAEGPVFCAGMDLAQMQETAGRSDAATIWQKDTEIYRDVLRGLFECPAPSLVVVQGPALAGGLGLVLACDLVIAAEAATFALPEAQRGIAAAVVTPLLMHRLGTSASSFLLLSGQSVDAARAHQIGLCHCVAMSAALPQAAAELERSILSGAPGALAETKRQLRACAREDVLAQLDRAAVVSAQARGTAEAREGLQAFLDKQRPSWAP